MPARSFPLVMLWWYLLGCRYHSSRTGKKNPGYKQSCSQCPLSCCMNPGQEAHEEDSSDSEADDPCVGQDTKLQESQSQPSSTSHRPRSSSNRAVAAWLADSGSDDSRRWSDQLSLDEKDGFIFVNYSEGQAKMHPHAQVNHPHPSYAEARHYSKLKPGKRHRAHFPCQINVLSALTHKAVCLCSFEQDWLINSKMVSEEKNLCVKVACCSRFP